MILVDRETYALRLGVCRRCGQSVLWYGHIRCAVCRCFMELKCRLASVRCPLGYW